MDSAVKAEAAAPLADQNKGDVDKSHEKNDWNTEDRNKESNEPSKKEEATKKPESNVQVGNPDTCAKEQHMEMDHGGVQGSHPVASAVASAQAEMPQQRIGENDIRKGTSVRKHDNIAQGTSLSGNGEALEGLQNDISTTDNQPEHDLPLSIPKIETPEESQEEGEICESENRENSSNGRTSTDITTSAIKGGATAPDAEAMDIDVGSRKKVDEKQQNAEGKGNIANLLSDTSTIDPAAETVSATVPIVGPMDVDSKPPDGEDIISVEKGSEMFKPTPPSEYIDLTKDEPKVSLETLTQEAPLHQTSAQGSNVYEAKEEETEATGQDGSVANPLPNRAEEGSDAEEGNPAESPQATNNGKESAFGSISVVPLINETTEIEIESGPARSRRTSTRNSQQPRALRPRASPRGSSTGRALETTGTQETSPLRKRAAVASSESEQTPSKPPGHQSPIDDENTPRPLMEANGLVMRLEEAIFVTENQLDEQKIARLADKKVQPFEQLTFQDLRTYNRDQLRAYCYAYGMARRKKTEMEADMARYLSYWNKGRPGFALEEYVPTSTRVIERVEPNPSDSIGAMRAAASVNMGSTSREGSATPSTSTAKGVTSGKPSSSRGTTPARNASMGAMGVKLSGTQGNSALTANHGGATGTAGNLQLPGFNQTGAQRSTSGSNRPAKAANGGPALPRGLGTSFKQRVHARQAGAKFKAAYNGAGPAIVNIVENAAAYFEGKDSPEVILDQAKSYERYQFNVDMLNEIFDGSPGESDESGEDVEMTETKTNDDPSRDPAEVEMGSFKKGVLLDLATRVASGKRSAQIAELDAMEMQFKEMEERTKYIERTNMRLFQRLERAENKEQIDSVKKEFEENHNFRFEERNPPPLVRRKLDKSLPPLIMADEKCRILRFKVS